MISKRYGKAFLFFTIIVMMMVVCYGAPSSSYAMASYDGFFAAPINQLKWKDCEIVREIKNGMLEMKARSSVNTSAVVMNQLVIKNPTVSSVQADVVPIAFNNPSGARPRVGIGGWGYNDGTGSTGN
jgi:hypothetical protein